jgi:hypothetical protein
MRKIMSTSKNRASDAIKNPRPLAAGPRSSAQPREISMPKKTVKKPIPKARQSRTKRRTKPPAGPTLQSCTAIARSYAATLEQGSGPRKVLDASLDSIAEIFAMGAPLRAVLRIPEPTVIPVAEHLTATPPGRSASYPEQLIFAMQVMRLANVVGAECAEAMIGMLKRAGFSS